MFALTQVLVQSEPETGDRHVDAEAGAVAAGDHAGVKRLPRFRELDHRAAGGALVGRAIAVVALAGLRDDPAAGVVGQALAVLSQPGVPGVPGHGDGPRRVCPPRVDKQCRHILAGDGPIEPQDRPVPVHAAPVRQAVGLPGERLTPVVPRDETDRPAEVPVVLQAVPCGHQGIGGVIARLCYQGGAAILQVMPRATVAVATGRHLQPAHGAQPLG